MWTVVDAQLCSRKDLRDGLTIDDYANALDFLAAKRKAAADAAQAQADAAGMRGRR